MPGLSSHSQSTNSFGSTLTFLTTGIGTMTTIAGKIILAPIAPTKNLTNPIRYRRSPMVVWFVRAIVWLMIHTIYRTRSVGVKQFIPADGACVLVCNHVSFVDALVVAASVKRPVRFVMYHKIFNMPVLGWIFRTVRAIPIAARHESIGIMERAFAEVRLALANGEVIGIFPEGKITTTGEMNEFKSGVERIITETPVPVVPMALRGLWGSFFSRVEGHAMRKPFRRGIWSRIELVAGPAMLPTEATAKKLESSVRELRGSAC